MIFINIILLLMFGALVGWAASVILKTNSSQGLLGDIVLGIIGALVGGYVMGMFGEPGVTGFNFYSFVVGVLGAIVAVVLGRFLVRLIS